jgi:putative transcriptional regulator
MCDNPRMSAGCRPFCSLAALLLLAVPLKGQSTRPKDIAPGRLLVASRDLGDPNFAHTVVLLVHIDEDSVVGLVLNRRTKVPVARALEDLKSAKGRPDLLYAGGPVGRSDVLALARSKTKLEDAKPVFGDVYLVSSAAMLEKTMAGSGAENLHVYAGYAGWTPKQLEGEVEIGAWYIFPADAGTVFAANPESLWPRFIERTEERVASLPALRARQVSALRRFF